jgi:L-ascorbate metabolism protein UlaG (beta-lactamase superfamily)
MKYLIILLFVVAAVGGYVLITKKNYMTIQNKDQNLISQNITVHPISHATAWLEWDESVIYTDPVGNTQAFTSAPVPDVVVVTDIHSDHFDSSTLMAVVKEKTTLVVPKIVVDQLAAILQNKAIVLANGDKTIQAGISIEAVPMYNIPEDPHSFHTKGRGNGYVLEKDGKRVYIAGDTSGIPEMRALKDIDIALVPMNLPYTMSVEEASSAVLDFAPRVVYPYHYRGQNGLSDVNKFKELVNAGNHNINVQLLNWYPGAK